MSLTKKYIRWMEWLVPSPFALAFILTLLTGVLAILFTENTTDQSHLFAIVEYWEMGFWDLLTFGMQMVLILVLGHTLALSKPAKRFIDATASLCTTNAKAAVIVAISAIVTGYLNWGLGLVYGAVLARRVAEKGQEKGIKINFPLIAACGYICMMVWHGGFSGSAPLDVASEGHNMIDQIGVISPSLTLGSQMNMIAGILILITLPLLAYYLGTRSDYQHHVVRPIRVESKKDNDLVGTDLIDHYKIFGYIMAALILLAVYLRWSGLSNTWDFFSLNNVNLLLFGLAVLAHGSFSRFISAIDQAVKGASGIIIQFPLYAGIMGVMKYSGLLALSAENIIALADADTFPIFAFFSSGIVNILVPSGGGQWQVQGPVLAEAAQALGYSIPKTVMSLAYGDQITNMLQPFWALPLLSITGLKAKDILPYSVLFMFAGGLIYLVALLSF